MRPLACRTGAFLQWASREDGAGPKRRAKARAGLFGKKHRLRGGFAEKRGRQLKKTTEYWSTPEGLALLEGWARDGACEEEIAARCGVTVARLRRWRAENPPVDEALRQEKDAADYQVEAALWKSAVNGSTTAQIYWLKNRRGGSWRDKPESEPQGTGSFEEYLAAVTGEEF